MPIENSLLSIIELGGYPDFAPLYNNKGFATESIDSMRKAIKWLKKNRPSVIVAEFNFQIDFRDRSSNLDSLMAVTQRMPATKVIVFYDKEQRHKLDEFLEVYTVFEIIAFPVDEDELSAAIDRAQEAE
jgi:DNA-binding NtrC family response regulator